METFSRHFLQASTCAEGLNASPFESISMLTAAGVAFDRRFFFDWLLAGEESSEEGVEPGDADMIGTGVEGETDATEILLSVITLCGKLASTLILAKELSGDGDAS